MFKSLPNTIQSFLKWPKTLKLLPKWRNFAKSGHTAREELEVNWKAKKKRERGRKFVVVAFRM